MLSKQLVNLATRKYAQCSCLLSQLAARSFCRAAVYKPVLFKAPENLNLKLTRHVHEASLLEIVNREITYETEREQKLPEVTGFTTKTEGTDITLKKTFGEETVSVTCNVNGSITPIETSAEAESEAPDMVSTPPFTITIEKQGRRDKLAMRCAFKEDTVEGSEEGGFEIVEMTVHDGDWNDKTYTVYGDVIDGAMYDQLMEMLEERGINHTDFCDQLVDLATEYDHKIYIDLLKSMQKVLS